MSMTDENLAQCEACGCVMDVSMMQPFANVECPDCKTHNRVKVNVGNYILSQAQGVGGMSLVFRAKDHTLGREVAIKILNESYSMDAKRIEQFEKEAQITAAISHPHVVRVYTVGQAYQRFYIAMELVPGDSLEQKMANERILDEKDILSWGREVCEGLSAANEAGLIHRDIKPGNILFDAEGHVKIVDFGLALVTQGGKAQAEEIWATPYYVPPETLDALEEDFRSDIYALGASLFHALCGKPPFDTDSRSTSDLKEIKRNLPSLKECSPHVSNATCAVIDKAMAFDPDDRYSSYKSFINDLYRAEMMLESGETEGFVTSDGSSRNSEKSNGNQMLYGLVATGVLLVGGGLAAKFLYSGDDQARAIIEPVNNDLGGISGSDDGGASGRKLANSINQARNALKGDSLQEAAKHYGTISRDSRFPIDSNMWGGVQSSILHWVNGNPSASKSNIRALDKLYIDKKNKGQVEAPNELTIHLAKTMPSFLKMEQIDPNKFENITSEPVALVAFSAALKNWEEGYLDEALNIWNNVEVFLHDKKQAISEELKFYATLIPKYQSDYDLMSSYRKIFVPTDDNQIKARRKELNEAKAKVKTKGRAVDNFKEWLTQLDIHKNRLAYERSQLKALKSNNVPPKPEIKFDDWDVVYAEISPSLEKANFEKARTYLGNRRFRLAQDERKKNSLIYLCGQANDFKKTLSNSLGKKAVNSAIQLKNGKQYNGFKGVNDEGVTIKDGNAILRVKWGEITTLSVIDLVKVSLSNENLNQLERNSRLEQAVAYAYLGGEKAKATAGVSRLSPKFQARWAEYMRILGSK